MQKFDVQIALEGIAEATEKWRLAQNEFRSEMNRAMKRLLHEAAANYMTVPEVAKSSGLRQSQVKTLMRGFGLNPANGKMLLAKQSAKALLENAELLGIEPHQMDLTSPLAYLPAGKALREAAMPKHEPVTEFPETPVDELIKSLAILAQRGEVRITVGGDHYAVRGDLTKDDRLILTEDSLDLLVKAAQQAEAGA